MRWNAHLEQSEINTPILANHGRTYTSNEDERKPECTRTDKVGSYHQPFRYFEMMFILNVLEYIPSMNVMMFKLQHDRFFGINESNDHH